MTGQLRLHETYRYPKPVGRRIAEGAATEYRDFFEVTRWPKWPGLIGAGRAQLERGIDAITLISGPEGERRPAILIGINPHKAGSDWTPWHDEIDPRSGYVRYYGDNKPGLSDDPLATAGNRALVTEYALHASSRASDRLRAAPLLVFESVIQEGRSKGYRRFRGLGLLERAERVVQVDRHGAPFVNYRFDCSLVRLADENNTLNWEWIAARRDQSKSLEETLALAPKAWRRWVKSGEGVADAIRQRLLAYRILSEADQRPEPSSPAADAVARVMSFYATRKHRFEALAERIAQAALGGASVYRTGWVTRGTGDRGIDFVGRLDLGSDAAPLRVVVAGQAKCQQSASGVAELSRLASKLNRGWVGVFVTTGFFSVPAQRELQDDGYPILLISGRQVGDIVLRESARQGLSVSDLLQAVDSAYESRIRAREPAEILSDE